MWSGTIFQLACGLLGLVALGAFLARGRSRAIWLGATLFGVGYMWLEFGWQRDYSSCPYLVTEVLLDDIRTWFPAEISGVPDSEDRLLPANARILVLLERRIPIRFLEPTTLEDFLKYLRTVTADGHGKGIPVFVDPVGLQEAEVSMTSTLRAYSDDYPLKTSFAVASNILDWTIQSETAT